MPIEQDPSIAPRPAKHTFTVDASYDLKRRLTGIGIIVQATNKPRRRGELIAEISEEHQGVHPGDTEKFAVYRALQIAQDMGCQVVTVRSDYNQMRKKLRKDHEENMGIDEPGLHCDILRLAREFTNVRFSYVARRKNQMAHRLARRAIGLDQRTKDQDSDYDFWQFSDQDEDHGDIPFWEKPGWKTPDGSGT